MSANRYSAVTVPYQADGSPGFICAGWLLRAATIRRQREAAA